MSERADFLGLTVFMLLVLWSCDPSTLGENAAETVRAYNDAMTAPQEDTE